MKIKALFFSLLIFSKVVMSQTGTIGSPFTSLFQARLVTSPGIEIVAHTDCRGSITYNMMLSKRRAIATANYLKSKGVSEKQLKIKYVGENQLTTNCPCDIKSTDTCSEDDHQKNRRASFNVIRAQVSNKGVINQ